MTAPGVIGPLEMMGALIGGAAIDAAAAEADEADADACEAGAGEAAAAAPCRGGFTLGETGSLREIEDFAVGEDDPGLRCNAIATIRPAAIRTIAEATIVARRFLGGACAGLTGGASGMLARRCAAAAGSAASALGPATS